MAQRTVALCNGKYIGIETIYTVISGRQINIPEKLKELRAKINAWETTLKLVQNEIMFAEKELEDMKIFQSNTEATYFG